MGLREAAQMALDAMLNFPDDISDDMFESIKALRAALAQPEQEPVAWFMEGTFEDGTPSFTQVCETDPEFYVPLYTAPPQREWQGLTDDDFIGLTTPQIFAMKFAEAKLREKNSG